jgi:hypothetical protein
MVGACRDAGLNVMALSCIGIANSVVARSACDDAIQFSLLGFWIASLALAMTGLMPSN